jgi:molybdenum cofactor cytidylyltransferase
MPGPWLGATRLTTAIVLAAGASTRLGQSKALVPVGGRAAVARLCATLRESGCPVIVVLGANDTAIRAAVPLFAKSIENPDWALGRTGSIQAALRTVWRDDNILVAPVDHPAVTVRTISALLRAKGEIRVPTFEGKRGHPTFFSHVIREEILALGKDEPLHAVVHRDAQRVTEVPVEDPAILLNVDTPDDLKKLQEHLRGGPNARDAA